MTEPKKRVVKRTPAQRAGEARYKKANHREKIRKIGINFSPVDSDILEYLEAKGNRSGYLKKLLREDMERNAGK